MNYIKLFPLLALILSSYLSADVISPTGEIKFDIQFDHQPEMTLNSTGLGIATSPSTNLHIAGNAIVTEQLFIGGSQGSSNLNINGTFGFQISSTSENLIMSSDSGYNSIILADTTSENILINLPYAGNVQGQVFTIKKTNSNNKLWIGGGGNLIDDDVILELGEGDGTLPLVKAFSDGNQWYLLEQSGINGTLAQDNLIGWWKLDETESDLATDSSQTGAHGNLQNSTFSSNSVAGKTGRALNFDGTDDVILVDNRAALRPDQFSISVWTKIESTPASTLGVVSIEGASEGAFFLRYETDDKYAIFIYDGNAEPRAQTSTGLTTNIWNHTVCTFDGSSLKIYLNGYLLDNESNSPIIYATTGYFRIGNTDNANRPFDGTIDDLRFYNKVLSDSEILSLYLSYD